MATRFREKSKSPSPYLQSKKYEKRCGSKARVNPKQDGRMIDVKVCAHTAGDADSTGAISFNWWPLRDGRSDNP